MFPWCFHGSKHEGGEAVYSSLHSSDGDLVTSVTPICSNDRAAIEVVARSDDDIKSEDHNHRSLLIRVDYICIGDDGEQVSGNLRR